MILNDRIFGKSKCWKTKESANTVCWKKTEEPEAGRKLRDDAERNYRKGIVRWGYSSPWTLAYGDNDVGSNHRFLVLLKS